MDHTEVHSNNVSIRCCTSCHVINADAYVETLQTIIGQAYVNKKISSALCNKLLPQRLGLGGQ